VKRIGRGVGVVACELETVKEKVECLQQKQNVKLACGSHIRSSKTHTEIILEQNIKTLLQLIPDGENCMITANGRLVKKGWVSNDHDLGRSPNTPRGTEGQHDHLQFNSINTQGGAINGPHAPRVGRPSSPAQSTSSAMTPGKPAPKRSLVEQSVEEQPHPHPQPSTSSSKEKMEHQLEQHGT
jgi:hypothetical protein